MADPRKQVRTPDDQDEVRSEVHAVLLAATEVGARKIGTTGASFVMIGMGLWAGEIAEVDGKAAAQYLRALANIFDPYTNENQKRRAEKDRAQAVRRFYAALDLTMTRAEGNG